MSRTIRKLVHHAEVAKQTGNTPTTSEDVFVIPNNETLRIEKFSGGHEYSTKEVRVELLHRVGGSDTVIAVGYGEAFQFLIDQDFAGNGADSIVICHVNGEATSLNMAAWWEGVTYG